MHLKCLAIPSGIVTKNLVLYSMRCCWDTCILFCRSDSIEVEMRANSSGYYTTISRNVESTEEFRTRKSHIKRGLLDKHSVVN